MCHGLRRTGENQLQSFGFRSSCVPPEFDPGLFGCWGNRRRDICGEILKEHCDVACSESHNITLCGTDPAGRGQRKRANWVGIGSVLWIWPIGHLGKIAMMG